MKTNSVATYALGLERNWRNFSDGGDFNPADSVIGGGMTGRSMLRGGKNFRIKLSDPVFDRTGIFVQWMFTSALSERN